MGEVAGAQIVPESPETIVWGAEDETLVEEQETQQETESAPEIIKGLAEKKKKIELDLSKAIDEETKKILLEEKRAISDAIIEVASERDGRDIKEDLKVEEQRQFEITLASMGKTEEDHKRAVRDKYYNEIIQSSSLPEEQKKEIIKSGEMIVGPFYRQIILGREDVATCIMAGVDPLKIKHAGFLGLSKKIRGIFIKNEKGEEEEKEAADINKFNEYLITTTGRAIMEKEIKQRIEQRKKQIIEETEIAYFARERIVQKILNSLPQPEIQPAPALDGEDTMPPVEKIEKPVEEIEEHKTVFNYFTDINNSLWKKYREGKETYKGAQGVYGREKLEEGISKTAEILKDLEAGRTDSARDQLEKMIIRSEKFAAKAHSENDKKRLKILSEKQEELKGYLDVLNTQESKEQSLPTNIRKRGIISRSPQLEESEVLTQERPVIAQEPVVEIEQIESETDTGIQAARFRKEVGGEPQVLEDKNEQQEAVAMPNLPPVPAPNRGEKSIKAEEKKNEVLTETDKILEEIKKVREE